MNIKHKFIQFLKEVYNSIHPTNYIFKNINPLYTLILKANEN